MATNKDKKHYISRSESRAIAKENSKAIRHFEKQKKRRVKPDDYTTEMKDLFYSRRFDCGRSRRIGLRKKRNFAFLNAACAGAQRSDCKRLHKI